MVKREKNVAKGKHPKIKVIEDQKKEELLWGLAFAGKKVRGKISGGRKVHLFSGPTNTYGSERIWV